MKALDIEHDGLAATELVDGAARMVIVHGAGPRIAWFGTRADNLLFWDETNEHARGAWRLRGGHRLWVTRPLADEAEETYAEDNAPCRVAHREGAVVVTAPPTALGLERAIAIHATRGTWTLEHTLRNTSDMLWSGGAWALTCTRPVEDTRYTIPLDGGSPTWDVLTMVIPRRWGGTHTSRLADPQFELGEDALALRPRGIEAKRMLRAPRGMLEMRDRRGTFVKQAVLDPAGSYPLDTNVAVYVGPRNFMVELETMGPIRRLAPGEALDHVETWTLTVP